MSNPEFSVQQPLPLAMIHGEAMLEKPEDLYIPPDALEVILETFEGPLDLLLYLIRKQKFDILNLPVAQITSQYMRYVDVMKDIKLELAGDYLLMAAILAEIKSRLLLPKRESDVEDEDDPRAELIRRLREYEVVKDAAQKLDELPRLERDTFAANADKDANCKPLSLQPAVTMQDLVLAFQSAMQRAKAFEHHQVSKEALSTRERMSHILALLNEQANLSFSDCFSDSEGKPGVVVSFLAVLELVKESLIELVQVQAFGDIQIRACNV